jgi:hypothetical protein
VKRKQSTFKISKTHILIAQWGYSAQSSESKKKHGSDKHDKKVRQ